MKNLKLFVFLFISITTFINCGQNNEKQSIKIDAQVLEKEYEENEIAADNKYKNQYLEISGEVSDISKGLFDEPVINLKDYSMIFILNKNTKEILNLTKGMNVTIKGRCDGLTLNYLYIKDCIILKVNNQEKISSKNHLKSKSLSENKTEKPSYCDCKVVHYVEAGMIDEKANEAAIRILGDDYSNNNITEAARKCRIKYWDEFSKWYMKQEVSSGIPIEEVPLFFYEKCKK